MPTRQKPTQTCKHLTSRQASSLRAWRSHRRLETPGTLARISRNLATKVRLKIPELMDEAGLTVLDVAIGVAEGLNAATRKPYRGFPKDPAE